MSNETIVRFELSRPSETLAKALEARKILQEQRHAMISFTNLVRLQMFLFRFHLQFSICNYPRPILFHAQDNEAAFKVRESVLIFLLFFVFALNTHTQEDFRVAVCLCVVFVSRLLSRES